MIEVILLERIEGLGQLGQVVKVRPGFARNLLLPKKKALRATKANLEVFEKQRAELEAKNAAMRAEAEEKSAKMGNLKLVVIRQASETGQLFGSVSSRDVAEAAKEAGHTIERQYIHIESPIKELGLFQVKVKLHPEVAVKITVNVARSPEEAVIQAEKGVALIKEAAKQAEADKLAAEVASIGEEAVKAEEPAKKAKKAKADKKEEKADEAEAAPKEAKKAKKTSKK